MKSIAGRLGGELRLIPGPGDRGLRATITLPALGSDDPNPRDNPHVPGGLLKAI